MRIDYLKNKHGGTNNISFEEFPLFARMLSFSKKIFSDSEIASELNILLDTYYDMKVGKIIPNKEQKAKLIEVLEIDKEDFNIAISDCNVPVYGESQEVGYLYAISLKSEVGINDLKIDYMKNQLNIKIGRTERHPIRRIFEHAEDINILYIWKSYDYKFDEKKLLKMIENRFCRHGRKEVFDCKADKFHKTIMLRVFLEDVTDEIFMNITKCFYTRRNSMKCIQYAG